MLTKVKVGSPVKRWITTSTTSSTCLKLEATK